MSLHFWSRSQRSPKPAIDFINQVLWVWGPALSGELIQNRGGIHNVAGCAPTPISRPMPRKCHLKFAGCFTMQIRCKSMRPTGYLASVIIIFWSCQRYEAARAFFQKVWAGEESSEVDRL